MSQDLAEASAKIKAWLVGAHSGAAYPEVTAGKPKSWNGWEDDGWYWVDGVTLQSLQQEFQRLGTLPVLPVKERDGFKQLAATLQGCQAAGSRVRQ